MGTVKYSGPVASFHCPTEATIRSLKVHFSPKQEGSGDPSPENVRPIVGWDGVVVHNDDGNVVPEEYQKVEYLESNGKQYLYTNIPIQTPFTVEADFMYHSDLDQCLICAGYNQDGRTVRVGALGKYKSNLQNYYAGYWNAMSISNNIRYKMRVQEKEGLQVTENNGVEVDRQTRSHNSSDIPLDKTKGNFAIFCMCRNGKFVYYCYAKLYSMTIWGETGTIVGKFIPCRRKSDDKPGMYDTVSGEFFTNQGTGEFICGPDIGQTTNYEFGVLGKNKLSDNLADYTLINSSADTVLSNGSYSGTVNEGQRDVGICKLNNKYPAGTYTLSFDYVNNVGNTYWRPVLISKYNDGSWYSALISTNPAADSSGHIVNTFTTNEDFYIHLTLNCFGSASITAVNSISNLQLELGSTATTYEPYDPNKTVYGGWVDLITGEVCATHTKYIFTGNENFNIIDSYIRKPFVWSFDSRRATDIAFASSTDTNLACNKLNAVSGRFHYLNDGCICTTTSSVYSYVLINGKEIFGETNEECNQTIANWYSNGVPLTIIAPLRSEYYQFYHLAPTQLQTFLGQNNVWSNADYVEVEYDLHETQTILARKQFIMANQPHIVKPAAAPLQNFVTDMAAPLKECKIHFSPVQEGSGDPSPDNVRAITGWTGVEVYRTGKNMLDVRPSNWEQGAIMNGGNRTASSSRIRTKGKQGFPPNTNITVSTTGGLIPAFHQWTSTNKYISDSAWLWAYNSTSSSASRTTDASCSLIEYTAKNNNGNMGSTLTPNDLGTNYTLQVELGSVATTYEPYSGTTLPLDWTDSGGTVYGGYVDLVTGEVWKDWDYYTVDGSQNIGCDSGYMFYMNSPWLSNLGCVNSYDYTGLIMANNFQTITKHSVLNSYNGEYLITGYASSSGGNWIYFKLTNDISGTDNTSAVKNYFSEHPLTVYFKLKVPTLITTLTPTQLKTLRGTNNLWSNSNDNIEIAYWTH